MVINTENLKQFRKEFKEVVKQLESKFKVTINLGDINYKDNEFTTKLTVTNSTGNMAVDMKNIFDMYCIQKGLKKTDYGKMISINRKKYKIVGIKPKSRKNCVIIQDPKTLKTFVTNVYAVNN